MTVGVGIIGTGVISSIYAQNLQQIPGVALVAVADIDANRARERAREFDAEALEVNALLADPRIEAVLNLTPPAAHAEVSRQAVRAGKHVYSEKPLAIETASARALLDDARAHQVRVGCAPDTFLGAGLQTCRQVVDGGWIGTPVAATAFMMRHGPEDWHPHPEFFYQPGGGPLFDVGPYYLTALVFLLGPIRRVFGAARMSFPERTIGAGPRYGEKIPVATPTHVAAHLEFESGLLATLVTSFDVWASETPWIEIYGSEGTLSVPDPNTFGGPVRVRRRRGDQWFTMPLAHELVENCRGIGFADMLAAIVDGRPHRADGALAYHVLEAMEGILQSGQTGLAYTLQSRVDRPEPLAHDTSWRHIP